MLVTVKDLVASNKDMKKGSHRVVKYPTGIREFIYYATIICLVNDKECTFSTNNGGYATSSTTRAINDYKRYFTSIGYTMIRGIKL